MHSCTAASQAAVELLGLRWGEMTRRGPFSMRFESISRRWRSFHWLRPALLGPLVVVGRRHPRNPHSWRFIDDEPPSTLASRASRTSRPVEFLLRFPVQVGPQSISLRKQFGEARGDVDELVLVPEGPASTTNHLDRTESAPQPVGPPPILQSPFPTDDVVGVHPPESRRLSGNARFNSPATLSPER